jgi:hypothetical protein
MAILIPRNERVSGVCYAQTSQGVELPVVDVTHPSFALDASPAAMETLRERAAAEAAQWQRRPRWLRRLLYPLVARQSVLLQGMRASHGTFLSGMNTYLFKLGPAHLATSFAKRMDRKMAAKASAMEVRYRLQAMAELLEEKLEAELRGAPAGRPVRLLNIAGGPAMDDLNALILARRRAPELLAGRAVRIEVLDLHEEGPAFGRNALAALREPGAPLAGVDAVFEHRHYDWNRPETLRESFAGAGGGEVLLGSSEGGLFHYGDDATIRVNLEALREYSGPGFGFTGSVGIDSPENRAALALTGAAVQYFKVEAFEALVRRSGWRIDRRVPTLRSLCVRLAKA